MRCLTCMESQRPLYLLVHLCTAALKGVCTCMLCGHPAAICSHVIKLLSAASHCACEYAQQRHAWRAAWPSVAFACLHEGSVRLGVAGACGRRRQLPDYHQCAGRLYQPPALHPAGQVSRCPSFVSCPSCNATTYDGCNATTYDGCNATTYKCIARHLPRSCNV